MINSQGEALRQIASKLDRTSRPPLEIHRWWARRHAELTRGMLISALASPSENIAEVADTAASFPNKVVLDPFAGSGTIVIEALRLGCRTIGFDLNPVAWAIMKNRLLTVDLESLDKAVDCITRTCSAETKNLYNSICPSCSEETNAKVFIWSYVTNCPDCKQPIRLLPSAEIVARPHIKIFACPRCGDIVSTKSEQGTQCDKCKLFLSKDVSNFQRGKITCANCGHNGTLESVAATAIVRKLLAVELICHKCGVQFKTPDQNDLSLVSKAKSELSQRIKTLPLPSTHLKNKPAGIRRFGFDKFTDFFSDRQLLVLGLTLKAIESVVFDDVQSTLLMLFSSLLEYNSILCSYNQQRGLQPVFSRVSFVSSLIIAEGNPWHIKNRGSWERIYQNVVRPEKEQLLIDPDSKIAGLARGWPRVHFASDFSEMKPNSVYLDCNPAFMLPLPDSSVDLVVTDPPYFDSVDYALLSDYYYVWLQPILASKHHAFANELTPRNDETQFRDNINSSNENEPNQFAVNLERAFTEIERVMKPDAPLVYIYRVPSIDSFKRTLQWTLDAGFHVTDFCPIDIESGKSFVQSVRNQTFAVDAVFYCYKRGAGRKITWVSFKDNLSRTINYLLSEIQGISRERIIEIIWGEFVRQFSSNYQRIYGDDGKTITVSEAVDWMSLIAAVIPGPGINISALAEVQAIRAKIGHRNQFTEQFQTESEQIDKLLDRVVSQPSMDNVEKDLCAQLGQDVCNHFEPDTLRFVLSAEHYYQQSIGKDIDFGPVAVAFAKPLENELRRKFCRHLAEFAKQMHLDTDKPKAGNIRLRWDDLATGKTNLGQIENMLRDLDFPENLAVRAYINALPSPSANYIREKLPEVIKEIRENGRNAGAHIDTVESQVVTRLRSIVLDRTNHVQYWVQM